MKKLLCFLSVFVLISSISRSQNTVGLLSFDADQASEGYNLFFPHFQSTVWLTDNCGRVVNSWPDLTYNPGNTAYLMDDGKLLKTGSEGWTANPVFVAGGAGEVLRIKDWDNTLLWNFVYSDSTHRLHHDVAPLPNGNVLAIAWEMRDSIEAITAGRDPSRITEGMLWPDHIIEVQPIYPDSFEIVWQWHAWDHLIQDFDSTKSNFGVVGDHPELIDINAGQTTTADWMHTNSIDYNEDYDQILISVPNFNEFWILDHSTTAAQAASHSGGIFGKGGDLLYRWGNPINYDAGGPADQKLFFEHDVHWMDLGLDPGHADYGKIMVYNNQHPGDWSSVDIINPPVDLNGFYTQPGAGNSFGPDSAEWSFGSATDPFFSAGLSGAQRMNNGNTLICVAAFGNVFEINTAGEKVWEYINPMVAGAPWVNGDDLTGANLLFRFYRYPLDFPAFMGRDLSPGDYIELSPDTSLCPLDATAISTPMPMSDARLYPNPARSYSLLEFLPQNSGQLILKLSDVQGHEVFRDVNQLMGGVKFSRLINVNDLSAGVYFLQLQTKGQNRTLKLLIP